MNGGKSETTQSLTTQGAAPDGDRAIPPRYWWLKRIVLGVLALFVLLLLLRLWWGHVAENRFEAQLDRYRAAGQPVDPEDFDPPPIDDEDNAALVYMQAANAIVTPPNVTLDVVNERFSTDVAEHLPDLRAWVAANAKQLELAHLARNLPAADWGTRPRSPMLTALIPTLGPQRRLAKLIGSAALYEYHAGEHEAAIERLLDLMRLGSAIDRGPSLISHLVAISVTGVSVNVIEVLLDELRVAGDSDARVGDPRYAARGSVKELIARLLEESELISAAREGYFFERTIMAIDTCRLLASGKITFSSLSWRAPAGPSPIERATQRMFAPLLQLDALEMCEEFTAWANVVSQPTWPEAVATIPPSPADFSGLDKLRRPVTFTMFPALDRSALLHFRGLAHRRMAALGLALRLYAMDHGELPEVLDVLVPEYLDDLPSDPFAADRRPFGYLPHRDRPILYSVGENGIDDGGRVVSEFGHIDYHKADEVFFLDGARPSKAEDLPTEMLRSEEGDGDQ